MNNFQAKAIKEASHYLEKKLNLFKKGGAKTNKNNAYKLEEKKETGFKKFIDSLLSK